MSGRAKGTPNKNKQRLMNALQAEYGEEFNPIMEMAAVAVRLKTEIDIPTKDSTASLRERLNDSLNAWDKIANYTEAKMRSVEISGDLDLDVEVKHHAAAARAILRGSDIRDPTDEGEGEET